MWFKCNDIESNWINIEKLVNIWKIDKKYRLFTSTFEIGYVFEHDTTPCYSIYDNEQLRDEDFNKLTELLNK